jgi:cytochrome c-type biogenesis protein CcmH/NrfG
MGRWWKSFSDSCKYLGASLAIVLVKRKLGRRPHDWTLWFTLGRLYEVGYQWPQAIDALKNARKLDPHNEIIAQQLSQTKEAAKQDSPTKR